MDATEGIALGRNNSIARKAKGAGIALVVCQIISICFGFVPIVNFINLLLIPAMFVLDGVAIVTGFIGLKRSREMEGDGKRESMIGLIIGVGHVLIIGAIFALIVLICVVGPVVVEIMN